MDHEFDVVELDEDLVEYVEESDVIADETELCDEDFSATNLPVYSCNSCNMLFHSVDRHIQDFHDADDVLIDENQEDTEATHVGEEIKYGFEVISDDSEPIESSTAATGFECMECSVVLKSLRSLKLHQKIHQTVSEEHTSSQLQSMFHCKNCNRNFDDEEHLALHTQGHLNHSGSRNDSRVAIGTTADVSKQANYPCSYCGKLFKRPYEKVKHERIHTGECPFGCSVCGKRFRTSNSLQIHLRTHDDSRPFVCSFCKKRFSSQSAYNHHLKTHSDARNYHCSMCNKSFKTVVQLNGHRKTHLKPFPCGECGRSFGALYRARKHMETHHKQGAAEGNSKLNHRCDICGFVYGRQCALEEHRRSEHGTELPSESSSDAFIEVEVFMDESSVIEL
ncbi:zinc finger protein 568-like isoform X2 [Uranotaenia lowii]|uniref:zinc finger protein 568-like isoform X2 n=1 Tax=Uranotaenia lowii TaxID=190385 RepID=UPI002479F915|nr:zinc finger protein 568-like isoform X2 [Uranotaenia lowii]